MRAILGVLLLLASCPFTWIATLPPPEIVTFTGGEQVIMSHVPYAGFSWQTRHATSVSLESGRIENGVFYPGGWYYDDGLPPDGSGGFTMKIDNYAARLCIRNSYSEPVCLVCDPTLEGGCG
ncbi:MAG: hypothetical protein K8J31_31205 [Anaerolineae bacterium]|jgi:hypothetical protein|nr:hypothetical protein [Anaerolineae bacterium]